MLLDHPTLIARERVTVFAQLNGFLGPVRMIDVFIDSAVKTTLERVQRTNSVDWDRICHSRMPVLRHGLNIGARYGCSLLGFDRLQCRRVAWRDGTARRWFRRMRPVLVKQIRPDVERKEKHPRSRPEQPIAPTPSTHTPALLAPRNPSKTISAFGNVVALGLGAMYGRDFRHGVSGPIAAFCFGTLPPMRAANEHEPPRSSTCASPASAGSCRAACGSGRTFDRGSNDGCGFRQVAIRSREHNRRHELR